MPMDGIGPNDWLPGQKKNAERGLSPHCLRWGMLRQIGHGVHARAVLDYLKVEVIAGAVSGAAHVADELSLADASAYPHAEFGHMGVAGAVGAVVPDGDVVAIAAAPAAVIGLRYGAVSRRIDGGAIAVGDVDAVVEGAPAGTIGGGEPAAGGPTEGGSAGYAATAAQAAAALLVGRVLVPTRTTWFTGAVTTVSLDSRPVSSPLR